jgi:hypothetical protein
MTSNARILGSLRSAGGRGIVRIEDRYDTDIDRESVDSASGPASPALTWRGRRVRGLWVPA